ncbi:UDP-glucuronosyltransferase 2B15-like, partial [Ceratina calcarata]
MNESTQGFVYFTFGSMVKIESMPRHYLEIFYKSLANIAPIRVLLKIAKPDELPPGLSSNVHVLTWLPQVKVLKHPNLKAFITHGGLMGTQEAIHYGVPLLGIPLFADQFTNIETYVRLN